MPTANALLTSLTKIFSKHLAANKKVSFSFQQVFSGACDESELGRDCGSAHLCGGLRSLCVCQNHAKGGVWSRGGCVVQVFFAPPSFLVCESWPAHRWQSWLRAVDSEENDPQPVRHGNHNLCRCLPHDGRLMLRCGVRQLCILSSSDPKSGVPLQTKKSIKYPKARPKTPCSVQHISKMQ